LMAFCGCFHCVEEINVQFMYKFFLSTWESVRHSLRALSNTWNMSSWNLSILLYLPCYKINTTVVMKSIVGQFYICVK
jgi:hypothetical protein